MFFSLTVNVTKIALCNYPFCISEKLQLCRFVVGPFEESGYMENREDLPSLPSQKTNAEKKRPRAIAQGGVTFRLISALCRLYRSLIKWVQCHNRHATCPHPFSCFYYTIQVCYFSFLFFS